MIFIVLYSIFFSILFPQNSNWMKVSIYNSLLSNHNLPIIELLMSELAYIAEQIGPSCDPDLVAETLELQDLTQFQGTEKDMLINEMLQAWNREKQSHTETRQDLARKLLELGAKYNGPPEQKPDFETLAMELNFMNVAGMYNAS